MHRYGNAGAPEAVQPAPKMTCEYSVLVNISTRQAEFRVTNKGNNMLYNNTVIMKLEASGLDALILELQKAQAICNRVEVER